MFPLDAIPTVNLRFHSYFQLDCSVREPCIYIHIHNRGRVAIAQWLTLQKKESCLATFKLPNIKHVKCGGAVIQQLFTLLRLCGVFESIDTISLPTSCVQTFVLKRIFMCNIICEGMCIGLPTEQRD